MFSMSIADRHPFVNVAERYSTAVRRFFLDSSTRERQSAYFRLAAGVAAIAMVGLTIYNSAVLTEVSERASRQDTQARGVAAVRSFATSSIYPIENRVCGVAGSSEALCGLLEGKSYRQYGLHDDLWVFYDAALATLNSDGTVPQRKELNAMVADVVAGAAGYGAWTNIRPRGEQIGTALSATDLYEATLAQAAACLEVADANECSRGLPMPLGKSINKLSRFLDEVAVSALPYEMADRAASIKAVLSSGLAD
jgi:hypothetical protein